MDREIYMDNAATTRMLPEVLDAMMPYLTDAYHNPSAIYKSTFKVRDAIQRAREQVAAAVNADPDQVFFTSGGTEADNWIIRGCGIDRIITSEIEHKAVLNACKLMAKERGTNTYIVPVDESGMLDMEKFQDKIRRAGWPFLTSVMAANNEIGTIQPLRDIGTLTHQMGGLFHTDAVQAIGAIPIDMLDMHIDFLSMSAHKFHGPKGIGALCCNCSYNLIPKPLIVGGSQQLNMRAGTENVAGIVGMGKAAELAVKDMETRNAKIAALRGKLFELIFENIPDMRLNGTCYCIDRLPNNLSVSFKGVESQQLLAMLDTRGICVSAGSACNAGSVRPSHVLLAIKVPEEYADGTIRFTLGIDTTEDDVTYTANAVAECVKAIREMNA